MSKAPGPRARAESFAGPHEKVGLSEQAYLVVRDRILKGQLGLGAPLSRRKLAAELNMSLLPISEALQRLESDGLVESRPRVGTRVCDPTPEAIRERSEVREALESQAARLFSQRASVRKRLELERMAGDLDAMFNRCFATDDHEPEFLFAVHSFHSQFHLRIAEGADCRALLMAIEKNQVLIFNWLFDTAARRPALPPRFHRELAAGVSQDDPEVADAAMRAHIRHALDDVVRNVFANAPAKNIKRVK